MAVGKQCYAALLPSTGMACGIEVENACVECADPNLMVRICSCLLQIEKTCGTCLKAAVSYCAHETIKKALSSPKL